MRLKAKQRVRKGSDSNFYSKVYHGKGIWYETSSKKIFLRSSWEHKYAQYLDRLNIKWEYEPKYFTLFIDNKACTYTPDFYLPDIDTFIEIKGYWRLDAKLKFKQFRESYSNIKIFVYGKQELKNLGVL